MLSRDLLWSGRPLHSLRRKHATCSCAVSSCFVNVLVVVLFAGMPESSGYIDGWPPAGFALCAEPWWVASSQSLELSAQAGTQALGSANRWSHGSSCWLRALSHYPIRLRAMDGTVLTTVPALWTSLSPGFLNAKVASKLGVRREVTTVWPTTSPSEKTVVFDVTRLTEAMRFDHDGHDTCDLCSLPLEYAGDSFHTMCEADFGCYGWQPSTQDRVTHSPGMLGLLSAINDKMIAWSPGTRLCSTCWLSKAHFMHFLPVGPLGDAIADEVGTFLGAPKGGRRHRWCDLLDRAFSESDEREAEEMALSHPDRKERLLQSEKEDQKRWEGLVHRHAPHLLREIGGGAR